MRSLAMVAVLVAGSVGASCGTRLPARSFPGTDGAGTTGTTATGPSSPGITPTTIKLGVIVSQTSPLGAETFTGPMYGARAFFQTLNAAGGVAGRTVELDICDDGSTGAGNRRCATKLINDDKVFAFVANSIYDYAAAAYVDQAGVPDVGGEPIGSEYDQYQHLWSIYGTSSPRDGTIGWGGKLYGGTEVYRYFAREVGARTAGVVGYNQADSQRFASLTSTALELEGYTVVREQLDFAVPSWDAAAIDMRAHGVDIVFDALDTAGNVSLCRAMDQAGLQVKAKVVTVQGWNERVRSDYAQAPVCRRSLYATATGHSYMDTDIPAIAQFRSDMRTQFPDREDKLSMWELDGWTAARWITDAITSCATRLERTCIEDYLRRPEGYDGHGAFTTRSFVVEPVPPATSHNCLFVARWSDTIDDGAGGWQTVTPEPNPVCYDVPNIPYSP